MKVYLGFGPAHMVGPIRLSAQHDPLNGDRAVPGLCLWPGGPARNNLFFIPCRVGPRP
jgi:hypothetical protein